ncbi:uncharacterized protein LOC119991496 [Tripterygium wilfordii]|uniref:uncharacterized protein LOC119991496 n=1 Tax=Tripterygium wilfordii TaxID=458696 RepID=UPI0018F8111E|nr:uncharacterized protein LOC119991496 [Tripterygium wilfordii]
MRGSLRSYTNSVGGTSSRGGQKRQRTDGQRQEGQSGGRGRDQRPRGDRGTHQGQRICHRCGRPGHLRAQCIVQGVECFRCRRVGHRMADCPQLERGGQQDLYLPAPPARLALPAPPTTSTPLGRGRPLARQPQQQQQSQRQQTLTQGRAFALTHQTAPEHPNFVGGMFLVSNCWARVLFDSGATSSFITSSFALALGLEVRPMRQTIVVDSPFGQFTRIQGYCICMCRFGDIELTVNLYVLDFQDFDVILGVDWLTEQKAVLDFWDRRITLNAPGGVVI